MPAPPEVAIVRIRHGIFPEAVRLNPRFVPGHPLLLATLDVAWRPSRPLLSVAALEERLLAFSPGFALHECRGEGIYHVFPGGARRPEAVTPPRGGERNDPGAESFEGALALAHLIEHAVIDFLAGASGITRCSGITAAHRSPPGRFDLMVECRKPELGRCCLRLAVSWLSGAILGRNPGARELDVLKALRITRVFGGAALFIPEVAKALGWSEPRSDRALAALVKAGYLVRISTAGNGGGWDGYRVGEFPTAADGTHS